MKGVAEKFESIPKTRVMTFGKTKIADNVINAPMNMVTTEVIKVEDANNYLNAFASNACTLKLKKGMEDYNFSIRFNLSVNGIRLTTKEIDSDICGDYFLRKAGFGNRSEPRYADKMGSKAVFSFKGFRAAENLTGSELSLCRELHEIEVKFLSCFIGGVDVSGASLNGNFYFYDGRFVAMHLNVKAEDQDLVVKALIAKYGPICDLEVGEWHNKLGVKFNNVQHKWCFKSGFLALQARGDKVDVGSLAYYDVNGPEAKKPVINF